MVKEKLTEARLILRNIDSEQVKALYEVYKNKSATEPLLALLDSIKQLDLKKIVGYAGGVNSVDKAIDYSVESAFRRGRISAFVLLRAMLINAEAEVERRERKRR